MVRSIEFNGQQKFPELPIPHDQRSFDGLVANILPSLRDLNSARAYAERSGKVRNIETSRQAVVDKENQLIKDLGPVLNVAGWDELRAMAGAHFREHAFEGEDPQDAYDQYGLSLEALNTDNPDTQLRKFVQHVAAYYESDAGHAHEAQLRQSLESAAA